MHLMHSLPWKTATHCGEGGDFNALFALLIHKLSQDRRHTRFRFSVGLCIQLYG